MNDKIKKIYKAIYDDCECTKEFLKEYLEVSSIKTVENNVKETEEIEYDIKLRKYRFKNLLPKYIPTQTFFALFENAIVNKTLKNDFTNFGIETFSEESMNMLLTSELSNLARKIIMLDLAIKYNTILKIKYKKANNPLEIKYIRPHSIFSNGFTYYVLITYDKLNQKNIGEERTLALNAIGEIEAIEHIKDGNFKQNFDGNAYGKYDKNKYIILNLSNKCANYFKREILFNNSAFEVLNEELEGDLITVKMYYNEIIEIVKLVQQWLPEITIINDSKIRNEVYSTIKHNVNKLLSFEND